MAKDYLVKNCLENHSDLLPKYGRISGQTNTRICYSSYSTQTVQFLSIKNLSNNQQKMAVDVKVVSGNN